MRKLDLYWKSTSRDSKSNTESTNSKAVQVQVPVRRKEVQKLNFSGGKDVKLWWQSFACNCEQSLTAIKKDLKPSLKHCPFELRRDY